MGIGLRRHGVSADFGAVKLQKSRALRLSNLVYTWMSVWPSQRGRLSPWPRGLGAASHLDLLLVPFLGVMLLVRVLGDDRSAPDSRHSGSLNLSAAIAVLFILVAIGLLLRRHHGALVTVLIALWLCIWMAIAVNTSGASTETLREGVREVSVIALAVIVYNARGAVTVPIATRLVQLVGLVPALLAIYQLATHTGMDVAGNIRAHGTFAHPNSAAMFFAIATTASLWQYLDNGRRRFDALLVVLFAASLVATFSIDGLLTLAAMLVAFGALHPGSVGTKLVPCALAGVVVLAFFATPLGARRVASETSTSLSAAERGETTSTFDTRLYRWKTLLPEWEGSPVFGRGIGTTTTTESTSTNRLNFLLPHNEYLRYLVETGVIGLAILIAALTYLIRVLFRKRKAATGALGAGGANAPTLALAIVAGCLLNSLADNTLLNSPTCYAAALIIAAVLALPGVEMRRASTPQTA
jgi:O-antigen ligase